MRTEEANGVEDLLVLCWSDSTQHEDFLNAQRFIPFEKPDALLWRANAERRAALPHLLGRGLPWMRSTGEALIAGVIALIIRRHRRRIIVAPHQTGALALLLEIPANELGAAPGDHLGIFVAVACR